MNLIQIKQWFQHHLAKQCQACGLSHAGDNLLCTYCLAAIQRSNSCIGCGKPLPKQLNTDDTILCGSCHQSPPIYDKLISVSNYSYPLSQLISGFKYQKKQALAQPLAMLLKKEIVDHYLAHKSDMPKLLLPVPLHFKRELSRGYNQSVLIGKQLQTELAIPLSQSHLLRTIATEAQAGLSRQKRLKNLAKAFYCQPLSQTHVAIIDDVVTTGATATQITKAVKKAGAKQVDIWCICRTEY